MKQATHLAYRMEKSEATALSITSANNTPKNARAIDLMDGTTKYKSAMLVRAALKPTIPSFTSKKALSKKTKVLSLFQEEDLM